MTTIMHHDDMMTPLAGLPLQSAKQFSDRPYADFFGRVYTYRHVADDSRKYADMLIEDGVPKGAPVALILPNCPIYAPAFYGILQAGCIVVNMNPASAPEEIVHILRDSGAKHIVTVNLRVVTDVLDKALRLCPECVPEKIYTADFADTLPAMKALLFKTLRTKDRTAVSSLDAPYDMIDLDTRRSPEAMASDRLAVASDTALLQYTGGTTGTPKAAILTHAALFANAEQCAERMGGASDDPHVVAGVLPFFHIFALTAVLQVSLYMGYCMILYPRPDIRALLRDIMKKRISILPGVPALFLKILEHKACDTTDFSALSCCVSGGAPISETLLQRFEEETGACIAEGYGLTEASPVLAFNTPHREGRRLGSAGLPLNHTVIDIIKHGEDDGDPLPPGEIGEIRARGPQIMQGYHGCGVDEHPFDAHERLKTGDAGYLDKEGYLYVVDRYKEVILVSGFNVYPRQVEDVCMQYPGVAECAVFGVPDKNKGDSVQAAIVLQGGADASVTDIKAFLSTKISYYKVPSCIDICESLPKTPLGKIDKKILKEQYVTGRMHLKKSDDYA